DELRRKVLLLIPFAHVRADLGLGELAHAAAQQLLVLGQPEVHHKDSITRYDARGGSMSVVRVVVLAGLGALCAAAPALADATIFIGTNTTPNNRFVRGFSVGMSLLIVGFEFEYSDTKDDVTALAPALKAGSGNFLLQTPFAIHGLQPYFTAG